MKQTYLRIGTHAIAYSALLVLSILSFSCIESPDELIAPTFDTPISLPVLDKKVFFNEFSAKSNLLEFNASDSTYSYRTTFTAEPIQIDSMSYQLASSDTLVALDVFDVDAISLAPKNVLTTDFGVPTTSVPESMPAGTFSANPIQYIDTVTFDYVAVHSGTLTLTVANNLPFPISFPEPIVLRNNWSSPIDVNEVASFSIPGTIHPGGSASVPSNLDNNFVRGLLTTGSITIHTTGTSSPITISASDGISLSFQSSPLRVDSAFAIIPGQQKNPIQNGTFTVDDSTVIKEAFFKSGRFSIALTNNTKISAQFHVTILDLFDRVTGETYQINTTIQGGESYNRLISMPALRITTSGDGLGTRLNYSVNVEVLSSQGEKRSVSKYDFIRAELHPEQPLVAQSVNGRIKPTPLSINSGFRPEYNLGKDIDKARADLFFKNMKLNLKLPMRKDGLPSPDNGIPFSYQNLELIAKNSKLHQTKSIMLSKGTETIINPTQQNPVIDISQESDIDNFTHFFSEFFPDLPDSFFVRGLLTISPSSVFQAGNFYNIYDTSKVFPSFDMSIPTDLSITNGGLAEVEKNPIKDEVDPALLRSVRYGTMNFEFTNRIPIALKFRTSFLKWNQATSHNDTLFVISPDSLIKAADVDVNRIAANSKISNIAITLTGPEVEMMGQADSVYIRLSFNAGNGQNTVKFRSEDYLHIRSSFNAVHTVNKP